MSYHPGPHSLLEIDNALADAICRATSCGFSDHEISQVSGIAESSLRRWEKIGEKETEATPYRYFYLLRIVARAAFELKLAKQIRRRAGLV